MQFKFEIINKTSHKCLIMQIINDNPKEKLVTNLLNVLLVVKKITIITICDKLKLFMH